MKQKLRLIFKIVGIVIIITMFFSFIVFIFAPEVTRNSLDIISDAINNLL